MGRRDAYDYDRSGCASLRTLLVALILTCLVGFVGLGLGIAGLVRSPSPPAAAPPTAPLPPEPAAPLPPAADSAVATCGSDHLPVEDCDLLIVGAGPAGLLTAYRLGQLARAPAELRVCVVEREAEVGGRARRAADHWRHTDRTVRCLAEAAGVPSWQLGPDDPIVVELLDRQYNVTNRCAECWSDAHSLLYRSVERYLAPNGNAPWRSMFYPVCGAAGLPDTCCGSAEGLLNYTNCSLTDCLTDRIFYNTSPEDINTTTLEQWMYQQTGSDAARHYLGHLFADMSLWRGAWPVQARAGVQAWLARWNLPDAGELRPGTQAAVGTLWARIQTATQARLPRLRLFLGESLDCLGDPANATVPLTAASAAHRFRAAAVVMAVPPAEFAQGQAPREVKEQDASVHTLGVRLARELRQMGVAEPTPRCVLWAAFAAPWWQPFRALCTDGACMDPTLSTHPAMRSATRWTFYDAAAGLHLDWTPTPEQVAHPVLRVEPDFCNGWVAADAAGTLAPQLMQQLHALFDRAMPGAVPTAALSVQLVHEPVAGRARVAGTAPWTTTAESLLDWAAAPTADASGRLCWAAGHVNWEDGDWMESVTRPVQACLEGALAPFLSSSAAPGLLPCARARDNRAVDEGTRLYQPCVRLPGESTLLDHYGCHACD